MGAVFSAAALGIAGCAAVAAGSGHYAPARTPSVPHIAAATLPGSLAAAAAVAGTWFVGGAAVSSGASSTPSTSGRGAASGGPRDATPASSLAAGGIPVTALRAYIGAASREALRNPACGLTWPLLAGIGRVESDHGRFAGAVLHSDGVSTPRIIGIPLNGHGTALITDTDGGQLDGDTVYDRAVGPMQFIPSTWAGWGVDADHDGQKNPFDVFDAAAAAADYLCAAGHDLRTYAGEVQAVRSYNNSDAYISMVLGLERVYASGAAGVRVPDPAPVTHRHPTLPPVDPGPPRGLPDPPTCPASHSSPAAHSAATHSTPSHAVISHPSAAPATCRSSSAPPPASSSHPSSSPPSTSRAPSSSAASTSSPPPTDGSSATGSPTASGTSTDSGSPSTSPATSGAATGTGSSTGTQTSAGSAQTGAATASDATSSPSPEAVGSS